MGKGTDAALCHLATPAQNYAEVDYLDTRVGEALTAVGFVGTPAGQDLRAWRGEVLVSAVEAEVELPIDAVCRGDSGGPAFALRDGGLKLVAIASSRPRGTSCDDGSPVNYTQLAGLRVWIEGRLNR